MDKQYSWKRTDEIEIDLFDLLRRLCAQWKRIAVCALAFAVILGMYGWVSGSRSAAVTDADEAVREAELTEAEKQAAADAVRLEKETRELETYLGSSVLMQIDAYHRAKCVMLFYIDGAKRQELQTVTESYLNFLSNGGAADALVETGSWSLDKNSLAELIYAYQKTYSLPDQMIADDAADSSLQAGSLFYAEVTGRDAGEAQELALNVQKALKEHAKKVSKRAGSHRLRLVSSARRITADSSLAAQQREKQALLSANRTSLKAAEDSFNDGQMALYKAQTGALDSAEKADETAPEENGQDEAIAGESAGFHAKYIVLGLLAGIFVYCGAFTCWYVFSDTVKSAEEMKRLYLFPVYGEMQLKGRGNRKPASGGDAYGSTEEQVYSRIRLMCRKRGITKLYAASDFPLAEAERNCLEKLSGKLSEDGIDVKVAQSASRDTTVWERMAENGNALLVCRAGTTTHRMIDDTMNFYLENGIVPAGAVVFSRNTKTGTGDEGLKAAQSGKGS